MYHSQEIELNCFVDADFRITHEQRTEECHGIHTFDDGDCEVVRMSVYIEVGNKVIDVTERLTPQEIKDIENSLEPTID
jgi:hypothetical protein